MDIGTGRVKLTDLASCGGCAAKYSAARLEQLLAGFVPAEAENLLVGPEMRRMYDEPDARAEIDASLREIYAAMFVTASPAPVKAALAMLGHDAGGLRLPLVECDDAERAHVHDALARHGLLQEVHTG